MTSAMRPRIPAAPLVSQKSRQDSGSGGGGGQGQQVVTVPCMMPGAGGSRPQGVARYRLPQEAAGAVHGGVEAMG